METPFACARTIADFLNEKFKEYDEKEPASGIPYSAYAGMLPRFDKAAEMKKHCPGIAVRPLLIEDAQKETLAKMTIYAVTYENDLKFGIGTLYHLLEFMRFHLLSNNPIKGQYEIKLRDEDMMETFIPDEQPHPFWIGRIDFATYLEQPSNSRVMGKMNQWGRRNNNDKGKKSRGNGRTA